MTQSASPGFSWSAEKYLVFEQERNRPAHDLVAAIAPPPSRAAIDLGCGPGNSTQILAARFPWMEIAGIDTSPEMIRAAHQRLPACQFRIDSIDGWQKAAKPAHHGVILANAVLQWLPDHPTLLPQLLTRLAKGGSLAVQMPDNLDQPSHLLMREVAANGPWAPILSQAAYGRTTLPGADEYWRMLRPHSRQLDIWRTIYHHEIRDGADGIVAWFEGSGLRPFLAPLDAHQRAGFLTRYREKIAAAYPAQPDGAALLAFPRLFLVARAQ